MAKSNSKSKAWSALVPGDIVDLVAPASSCSQEELESAMESVKQLGLIPRLPESIFDDDEPLFSTSDKKRFEYLKRALLARDSKAIWCLRGGYGSLRILPALSKLAKPKTQKLFIGLSDITSLHIFLNQKWRWKTIHGPMLGTFSQRINTEQHEIADVVFGRIDEISFLHLEPLNAAAKKKKKITGVVRGGNLLTVQGAQGTPWNLNAKNSILFFEEVNERGYRNDRMFSSLIQSGLFKNAKAVVLGDFIGGNEPDGQNYVNHVIQDFASQLKIPVLRGIRSGHGDLRRPVPFNTNSVLKTGLDASLICAVR
ncbi:MAG: LD-carboxypeptidase [Bdellovibrionales bacterium]